MVIRNMFIVIAIFALLVESSADTCGLPKANLGLIVHGQSFPRGSFPWIVALISKETDPPSYFCGGTVISRAFVISGK